MIVGQHLGTGGIQKLNAHAGGIGLVGEGQFDIVALLQGKSVVIGGIGGGQLALHRQSRLVFRNPPDIHGARRIIADRVVSLARIKLRLRIGENKGVVAQRILVADSGNEAVV